jgi:hypothetical protein
MSSIHLPLDEPLSPELVLVCPELAERARHFLPDPRWMPSARAEASARVGLLQMVTLVFASIAIPATPLVLLILAQH